MTSSADSATMNFWPFIIAITRVRSDLDVLNHVRIE